MLRHRHTTWTEPPSSSAVSSTISGGGASCPTGGSNQNLRLTEIRSIIDEIKVDYTEKRCDNYQRYFLRPPRIMSYLTSSQSSEPFTNYCVWVGRISSWRVWWDNPISGTTFGESTFGDMAYPIKGLPSLVVPTGVGTYEIVPTFDVDSRVSIALNAILPAIKSELSVPNSIYELKDIVTLKNTWLSISRLIERLKIHKMGSTSALYKTYTLKALVKATSSVYLQKSFNADPLISDFKTIRKVLLEIKSKIDKILVEEGKVLKKHFSMPLSELEDDMTDSFPYVRNTVPYRLWRRVTHLNPRFHVTVVYSYRLTQYEREHAHILGLLDAFGVNWRPSIIWNAIPWSFVVDWFLKIGNWLDNFQLRNIEPINELHSVTWSMSGERHIEVGVTPNYGQSHQWANHDIHTHTIMERFYKRVPLSRVNLYKTLETSGLSLKELSLALALKFS